MAYDERKFKAYQVPGVDAADFRPQSNPDIIRLEGLKHPKTEQNKRAVRYLLVFLVIILAIILIGIAIILGG